MPDSDDEGHERLPATRKIIITKGVARTWCRCSCGRVKCQWVYIPVEGWTRVTIPPEQAPPH